MFPEIITKNFDRVKEIAFSDLTIEEKMRLFNEFDDIEVFCKNIAKTVRNCFLPVGGFDDYAINPYGEVISNKGYCVRLLSPGTDSSGYLKVILCRNGKHYNRKVHKLVTDTFLLNPDQMPQVNHVDCDKKNNRLDNLEYCTQAENLEHAFRTGLHSKRGRLTEDELNQIVEMLNAGVIYKEIADIFNLSPIHVQGIATGRCHKKVYEKINIPANKISENKFKIKVKCLENGKTYDSIKEAAIDIDIDASHISKNLKGKLSHVGGFHFIRVEEES